MPTLLEYRQDLAQRLGGYGQFTANSGNTTQIACTAAFTSTELPTSAFPYVWVYVPSATFPKQRRIRASGLDPTTGTITLEAALGSSVAPNTTFELHTRLPAARETTVAAGQATMAGLHECLTQAHRHILVDHAIGFAAVNGQFAYGLTAFPWLDRDEYLVDVLDLNVNGTRRDSSLRTWVLRKSVTGYAIQFDEPYRFSSGSYTINLQVRRPSSTIVNGADSLVGLVAEADTAGPDLNTSTEVALVYAYAALRDSRVGSAKATYAALYADQLRLVRTFKDYDHTNDIDPSVPSAQPGVAA